MTVEVNPMDIKKTPQTSVHNDEATTKMKVQDFISDVKTEITKVNWTSPEELRVYAKIVVLTTLVFGFGIYFTDLIIQAVLNGLSLLVRVIAG